MAPKKELPPAEGELRELKERMKKIELALEKMQEGEAPVSDIQKIRETLELLSKRIDEQKAQARKEELEEEEGWYL